jgi:predicted nucleic acid-binding protein
MSRIFWDTNLFIYLFEGLSPFRERVTALRQSMLERGDQLATSTLTLGEVLVKPMERGEAELCSRYEAALAASALLIPFTAAAARVYAKLRQDRSIRPPDAIQLACAAAVGVDLFVTNDARLQTVRVDGIQFIVPLERVPL